MKWFGTVSRLIAVFAVLMALAGLSGKAFAQDDGGTTVTDSSEGTAQVASYYVGVSCWTVDDGANSTCQFAGYSDDGSPVEALWVPDSAICTGINGTDDSTWVGDGYHSESSSITLSLAGAVSVGGSANYILRSNGEQIDTGGDGLICDGGYTSLGDTEQTADPPTDQPAEEPATDQTGDVSTSEQDATPEASPADATPDTGETGGDASTQAVDIEVPVTVYNCSVDPGGDPGGSADCALADGVDLSATADGSDIGTATTAGGGLASFTAPEGSELAVTETVPSGYQPVGNGTNWVNPVAAGSEVVFVNVLEDELGRLQIVNGLCPSSTEKPTEFDVIAPNALKAASELQCEPTGGTVFTITGGVFGGGGIQVVTDAGGVWRGFLPAGDYNYTLIDDSGASVDFPVYANDITAVVVVDFYVPEGGTLTISKILCIADGDEGTVISVDESEQDPGSCSPSDGDFSLTDAADLSAQSTVTFSLGADGVSTQNLPVGDYVLTDLFSDETANISVAAGGQTFANVRTVSNHGTLVVRHYFCSDPASNDEDPTDFGYWDSECSEPNGGVDLTLFDENGDPVDTETGSAGGVITWQDVAPGAYSVDSGSGLCAAFVEGDDARGGFYVNAGATTLVQVYTCASPDGGGDDDGDDDGGNGDDDGGNNGDDDGGDGTGTDTENSGGQNQNTSGTGSEVSGVTQLPATGIESSGGKPSSDLLLAGLLIPGLLAAAALYRRRTSAR